MSSREHIIKSTNYSNSNGHRYGNSKVTTNYSSSSNTDHRLDELLEDLQANMSKPVANGTSTGYKEIIKSVKKESSGKPAESSQEYHIEYLNPSNSTTVIPAKSSNSYFGENKFDHGGGSDQKLSSYKTTSYEYNTSKSNTTKGIGAPTDGQTQVKFRQNIDELDTLLSDLNHTQKTGNTFDSKRSTPLARNDDHNFLEPLSASTPHKSRIARFEEKRYEEERYGSLNPSPVRKSEFTKEVMYTDENGERYHEKVTSSTPEPKKDLVFTGGSSKYRDPSPLPSRYREPSPARQMQEVYRYETKTTTSRKEVPTPLSTRKVYDYKYEADTVDNAIPFDTSRYNRSPSPVRSIPTSYTTREPVRRAQSPSPARSYYTDTVRENTTVREAYPPQTSRNVYSSVKTTSETNRREIPRSPPPHRSPSPISFAQPPDPYVENTSKTYGFDKNVRSVSPTPGQKFSPSDPSRGVSPTGQTIISRNYKYTTHSTQQNRYPGDYPADQTPLLTRPFPTPSPTPEVAQQRPPKQLNDLMASFSDTDTSERHDSINRSYVNRDKSTTPAKPTSEPIITTLPPSQLPEKYNKSEKQKSVETNKSNGVSGPPVYYPPGPLFTKKEESSMMEQGERSKGGMKAKRKAKYKYESGEKMKESSGVKKTWVPCCLPVCCALPCVIM